MAEYPQILAVCDRLLPEDVQRESSGVGGAAAGPTGAKGAAADAKRREESKRRAREDNAHLKAKKKQAKNAVSVQETAAVAMHSVASGLGLPPGGLSELFRPASEPAPAAAPSPQNIVDEKTAKLRFFDTLFESFQAATKNLKQAKAEAAGGDSAALEMVGFLKKKIAKIRTEMAEWDKSPL
ncbi:unnamed protein product [Ectocarpus sp. CCAP 1310/34]|nr:unnamed protein product [Ectocarpus sp. CCAP 1310/34]